MTELKPCPFCGGEAFVACTLDKTFRPMCKCDGCCALDSYTTAEAACIAWNKRVPSVLDAEIIEHLHTALHERGEELARLRENAKAEAGNRRTIYVQWSDDGKHIRKWDWTEFDLAERIIAETALVSDTCTPDPALLALVGELVGALELAANRLDWRTVDAIVSGAEEMKCDLREWADEARATLTRVKEMIDG